MSKSTEFVLRGKHPNELSEFKSKMEHGTSFSKPLQVFNPICRMPANEKYIFVWTFWSHDQVTSMKYYSMIDDMNFEMSFMSKFGTLEEESHQLTGQ